MVEANILEKPQTSLAAMWGNVIVKLDDPDKHTSGGIIIPDLRQEQKLTGTVMHAGVGRTDIHGVFHPTQLKPGDKVIVGRHLGYSIPHGGTSYYLIPEKYIEAVTNDDVHELDEEDPAADINYEYLFVDFTPAENVQLYENYTAKGWEPRAWKKDTKHLVWMRREAKPWYVEETPAFILEMVEKEAEAIAASSVQNWCGTTVEPQEEFMGIEQEAPHGWEYLNHIIQAYKSEENSTDSMEWIELARLQKEGWQIHEKEESASLLRVLSFKRAIK